MSKFRTVAIISKEQQVGEQMSYGNPCSGTWMSGQQELELTRGVMRAAAVSDTSTNCSRIVSLSGQVTLGSRKHLLLTGLKPIWPWTMTWKTKECGFDFQQRKKSPKDSDRLWDPPRVKFSVYWNPFAGIKRPLRERDHSPSYSAEVKNEGSCTAVRKYAFITWKETVLLYYTVIENEDCILLHCIDYRVKGL